jgi:hypothetical protein
MQKKSSKATAYHLITTIFFVKTSSLEKQNLAKTLGTQNNIPFPTPAGSRCSPSKNFPTPAGSHRQQEITSRRRQGVIADRKLLLATGRESLPEGNYFSPSAGSHRRKETISRHRQGVIADRKLLPATGRESLPAGNHFSPSAGSHCRQETISRHRQRQCRGEPVCSP